MEALTSRNAALEAQIGNVSARLETMHDIADALGADVVEATASTLARSQEASSRDRACTRVRVRTRANTRCHAQRGQPSDRAQSRASARDVRMLQIPCMSRLADDAHTLMCTRKTWVESVKRQRCPRPPRSPDSLRLCPF